MNKPARPSPPTTVVKQTSLKSQQVTVLFNEEERAATVIVQAVVTYARRRDVRAIADRLGEQLRALEGEGGEGDGQETPQKALQENRKIR